MFESEAQAAAVSPRFAAFFMNLGIYGLGYDSTKSGTSRYFYAVPGDRGAGGVWFPQQTGALNAALPPVLQPLEQLKRKIAIVSGLGTLVENQNDGANHSSATTAWLTGAFKSYGHARGINVHSSGTGFTKANNNPPSSIDQVIANSLKINPGSSLVMNTEGQDYSEQNEGGHGGYISYNSLLSPGGSSLVPKTTDALKAFNSIFGNCKTGSTDSAASASLNKSVLDAVGGETVAMQKRLGKEDKARLDSYLQGIRELELRLTASRDQCPGVPFKDPFLSEKARADGGMNWVVELGLMVDVLVLALYSGAMPVATLMSQVEAGGTPHAGAVDHLSQFVGIGGQKIRYRKNSTNTHFDGAHEENGGKNIVAVEEHIAYSQMLVTFINRIVTKLDSFPLEPNGLTPLDNSVILAGACHADSGQHWTKNLPTLLAGGKGFGMVQGQHIAVPQRTDIGNLHYTIANAMGVQIDSFNGHKTLLKSVFS